MTRADEEVTMPFNEDILARAKHDSFFCEVVSTGLEGQPSPVSPGRLARVPAGTRHNFVNEGSVNLKHYTV